jgi:hypothetical protein
MRTLAAVLLATGLALLSGCVGSGTGKGSAPAPKAETHLALLGVHALALGSPIETCERAFPPPEDAESFVPDVPPGWPYTAWRQNGEEQFAAVFQKDKGKGLAKAVHRVRVEDMKEANGIFALYEKWYGKGKRTESVGRVEVTYVRGNERLMLWTTVKGTFITFNESLENTALIDQPGAK